MNTFKESFAATLAKSYQSIAAIFFAMILARTFSEEQYGTYRQMLLIANFLNIILFMGIPTTISYYYRILDNDGRNRLMSNMLTFKVLSAVTAMLILFAGSGLIAAGMHNSKISSYMVWIAVLSGVYIVNSILESSYIASENTFRLCKYQIIFYTLYYLTISILIIYIRQEQFLIFCLAIFELMRTILMFLLLFRRTGFRYTPDLASLFELVKFSLPLGISFIVDSLSKYMDSFVISNFFTPQKFAVFSNAATSIPIVDMITVSVATVIFPKMSKISKEDSFSDALALWKNTGTNNAIIIYPLFFLFLVFADGYISFVFSAKYMDAALIFRAYLLRFIFTFGIVTSLMVLADKKKLIVYTSIANVIINFILCITFVKIFGMVGAAAATVISEFFIMTVQILIVIRYKRIRLSDMYDLKTLSKAFLVPVVPAAVLKLASMVLDLGSTLNFFIYGTILVCSVFGLYILTGVLKREYVAEIVHKAFKSKFVSLRG